MLAIAMVFMTWVDPHPYPEVVLEEIGQLKHPEIREASGVIKSRKHSGIYWVHNDSENPSNIFAVQADGTLVREFTLNALNIDWEDIATDDDGHLYIGDIGNNFGRLPLRVVHQIDEPDPADEKASKIPIKVQRKWHYQFPKEGRFDAEGMFIRGNSILIVDKAFEGEDAKVYSFPMSEAAPLLKPLIPKPVGKLPGFVEPVTGADLSADGKRLVVCSNFCVGVYEPGIGDDWKAIALRSFKTNDQIEAVCWDGLDIILAGEERGVFKVSEKAWRTTRLEKGKRADDHAK